jgi:hypothetical protein
MKFKNVTDSEYLKVKTSGKLNTLQLTKNLLEGTMNDINLKHEVEILIPDKTVYQAAKAVVFIFAAIMVVRFIYNQIS